MVGAVHVANSILLRAKRDNVNITPKMLYYLMYLLYSNVLYKCGIKLFNEPFSVTSVGPIIPSIYYKFYSYGNKKIKTYASNAIGEIIYLNCGEFNKYIEEIWGLYKNYSEVDLYNIITSNNSAFDNAIKNNQKTLKDSDILNDEIKKKEKEIEKAKVLRNKLELN